EWDSAAWRASRGAEESGMILMIMRSRYGCAGVQYFALRTRVRWSPRTHSCNWNGPSPTGEVSEAGFFSTSVPRKMCAGRMAAFCSHARENRKGPNGLDNRMTTVSGSGVSISLIALPGATNFEPYLELTSSKVNFTSSEVSGLPSFQVAETRWKVYVRPSAAISQDLAREG